MNDPGPVGVGPRAVAFLIDWLLLTITIVVVWEVAGGVNQSAEHQLSVTHPNTGASLLIVVAALVYFGGLESAWGATVGKRAVGLRVAMVGGGRLTGRAVMLRTLGRLPDCFLFSPLVAGVMVVSSARRQRLGDRWAGTIVVRSRR